MYSPTLRLLTVLEMLQSSHGMSGPEIAAKLEVDVRSVRRYITMLRDLGIPVESEPGRYGLYQLTPGYRLPPLMFNNSEILAVILGLTVVRRLGLLHDIGVDSAAAKIERVLPEDIHQRAKAVQNILINAPVSVSSDASLLGDVSLSAYENQQLWIAYATRGDTPIERVIDVYGLVHHGANWYAVAFCHLRNARRVFRLDRIVEHRLLSSYFDPPEDFDVLNYLLNSFASQSTYWRVEVLLQQSMEWLRTRVTPDVAYLEQREDGVLMTVYTDSDSLDWCARYLMNLNCPFQILQPPEMHDALRGLADRILQMAEPVESV
jgi:predicted DNA-binding transcriptional regulator YafY